MKHLVSETIEQQAVQWSDELGTAFGISPDGLGDLAPTGAMSIASLGSLSASRMDGNAQIVRRTARAVRREPHDLIKIFVPLDGPALLSQDGFQVRATPGQMVIYENDRPFEMVLERPWRCVTMAFTPDALSLPRPILQQSVHRIYPVDDGPGAVLVGFVSLAIREGASAGTAGARMGEAGLHLIAGTLGTRLPADEAAEDAQRISVLQYIRAHLAEPDLTHDRVAAAFRMSSRTLHRLFEDQPHTVSEYIRTGRLESAKRDLTDPLFRHRSIASVAGRWGFASHSHFTRAFQAEYGVVPSAVRHGIA